MFSWRRKTQWTQCILVSNTESTYNLAPQGVFKCLFTRLWWHFEIIAFLMRTRVDSLIDSFFIHVKYFSWNLKSPRRNILKCCCFTSPTATSEFQNYFSKKNLILNFKLLNFACWSCFFSPNSSLNFKYLKRGEKHQILVLSLRCSVQSAPSCWLTRALWGTTWSSTRGKSLTSVRTAGGASVRKVTSECGQTFLCQQVVLKARRLHRPPVGIVELCTCSGNHTATFSWC